MTKLPYLVAEIRYVDYLQAEGPEVGFTRPVEGTPNVEYLSSADPAMAEDTLLETLN